MNAERRGNVRRKNDQRLLRSFEELRLALAEGQRREAELLREAEKHLGPYDPTGKDSLMEWFAKGMARWVEDWVAKQPEILDGRSPSE